MIEAFSWIFNSFLVGTLLPFFVVLGVVVFVHEMGHFLVGRWCGVKVEAFAIGFGPELVGWNDRQGTRWKLCAIPLGGYVKFFGDADGASAPDSKKLKSMSASERAVSFHTQKVWKRASIVAAGPMANFLFSIFVFSAMFLLYGEQYHLPRVGQVVPNTPAQEAGIKKGDLVLAINGTRIRDFRDMARIFSISADEEMPVLIMRDGVEKVLTVTPRLTPAKIGSLTYERGAVGIESSRSPEDNVRVRYGPITALTMGIAKTGQIFEVTFQTIGKLFSKPALIKQMSGPLGIGHVSSVVAERGVAHLVNLIAWISVSIGLLNLFPIPMLDGGHLMFYLAEVIRGKPLSEKTQEYGFGIGAALVLTLLLVVTWSDGMRIITSLVEKL